MNEVSVDIDIGGMVCVFLGDTRINRLSMTPTEAKNLAEKLTTVANLISPEKPGTLFKGLQNTINNLMLLCKRD